MWVNMGYNFLRMSGYNIMNVSAAFVKIFSHLYELNLSDVLN